MNQTITCSDFTAPTEIQSNRHESLLKIIRDRLSRALSTNRAKANRKNLPQTFLEENLLDDVMGPEIRRTLRV